MFGLDGGEHENAPDEVEHAAGTLNRARSAGKPVFVVEYVSEPAQQQAALQRLRALGFIPTFTTRALNTPPTVPLAVPAPTATTKPQQ